MSAKLINKNVIWHSMNPARVTPDEFMAVIEIPKGSKKKYELDKETGMIVLDRVLRTATHYPCSYGLIPLTLSEDNDPLDVMVICSVKCRPVGLIEMIDKGEKDEKIIAVAVDDPYVNHYQEINDVPKVLVDEIEHFLKVYKNTTDKVEVFAPKGKADAKKVIQDAIDMYKRDVL